MESDNDDEHGGVEDDGWDDEDDDEDDDKEEDSGRKRYNWTSPSSLVWLWQKAVNWSPRDTPTKKKFRKRHTFKKV